MISAGANDVYKNNSKVALVKTIKIIQNNSHTNIILLQTPHRYDLVEYSCVNRAIQAFNYKLREVANSFNHVTLLEWNHNREYFTKHGMHLNKRGKGLVSKLLALEIMKIKELKKTTPIRLGWKVEQKQVATSEMAVTEARIMYHDILLDNLKDKSNLNMTKNQHVNKISGNAIKSVNSETITKDLVPESPSPTKSKRQRKAPITRSKDFLW